MDHGNAAFMKVSLSRRSVLRGALAGAGAVGLTQLLAACAPGGRPGASSPGLTELTVAAPGAATGQVSQILISGGDSGTPKGKAMLAVRDAWLEANPEASLDFETLAFDQVVTASLTRARAGELADVVQLYPGTLHEAAFAVLAPFDRSIFGDLAQDLHLWDYTTVEPGGQQIGVPVGNQGAAWYFNRRLFEKAGLDPEATPGTWAELEEIVAKLKDAGIVPMAMSRGYVPYYMTASLVVPFLPEVSDIDDFRAGRLSLEDDRFRIPLNAASKMAQDGWFHPSFLDKEDDSARGDFAQGNAAMLPFTIIDWADIELHLAPEDLGVFLPPALPEAKEQVAYVTPDVLFGLNARSENAESALSWMAYLASKEAQETKLRIGGNMPNRSDIDVAAIVDSPAALTIQDWITTGKTNEVAYDFFKSTASETFYSRLPTALLEGEVDDMLAQLQNEQSAG